MIFVSGGSGFIGSHLLKLLVQEGREITALYRDKKSSWLTEAESNKINWIQGDILDADFLYQLMQDIEQVYHCAAMVSFDSRMKERMDQVNVQGTANMVNACVANDAKKFVHLSSVASLGRSASNEKIDENAEWNEGPYNSQYAVSKHKSELEVWRGEAEGLNVAIVNPGIVLGEGNWLQGSCGLFKNAIDEFPFYTNGHTSFVDVKDVAKAMWLLMESDVSSERFILSEGNYDYKVIFDMMAKNFKKKGPKHEAKPWMISLVWRWYEFKKYFTSKEQSLSKETARSAQARYEYSNEKFLQAFPNFSYTHIEECIARACGFYLER